MDHNQKPGEATIRTDPRSAQTEVNEVETVLFCPHLLRGEIFRIISHLCLPQTNSVKFHIARSRDQIIKRNYYFCALCADSNIFPTAIMADQGNQGQQGNLPTVPEYLAGAAKAKSRLSTLGAVAGRIGRPQATADPYLADPGDIADYIGSTLHPDNSPTGEPQVAAASSRPAAAPPRAAAAPSGKPEDEFRNLQQHRIHLRGLIQRKRKLQSRGLRERGRKKERQRRPQC